MADFVLVLSMTNSMFSGVTHKGHENSRSHSRRRRHPVIIMSLHWRIGKKFNPPLELVTNSEAGD